MCLPGIVIWGIESPRGWCVNDALVDAGVAIPEVRVEARDEGILDSEACPLTLECTDEGFFAPQAIGAEVDAGALAPPPRAGKASSEWVFRDGKPFARLLGGGRGVSSSLAFCFPAAFSDMGFADSTAGVGSGAGAASIEGGGWAMSSSSTSSSIIGW